ncbi:MAG: hypoxanthine phosphoribosyltransferase [Chitinophagales bacterium]|nr:hypoxanthine phosphoribosyltransferase [Chitinophagales bacterium]
MLLHDKQFGLFIPEDQIHTKVFEAGKIITEKFHEKNPVFIIVLNGAWIFGADLIRQFPHICEIRFVKIASYSGMQSQNIQQFSGFSFPVAGRHVIIIEDIVDSGKTLQYLYDQLKPLQPASVFTVALFQKKIFRNNNVQADLAGFEIPDVFIVGYGLDYNELGRNLKDVWRVM